MMEAIMKKTTWAALALLLMILMVLGLGCSTDKGSGSGNNGGTSGVGSVQIIMATDTLRFLPGDSASAQGFVVVKDDQGRAMPGVKVNLALSEQFGWIEYVDNSLRDTTGSNGRVDFRFRTYNQVGPGYNTVTATVGGKQDSWTLWVQPAATVLASLRITVSRSLVQVAPPLEDSVTVTVTISDSGHTGVAGITLPLRATGGRLSMLPPTDASGRAQTMWYTNNEPEGTYALSVRAGGLADTARVTVVTLPNVLGTLNLTTDRLIVHADNCITSAQITATLKNQRSIAVPGDTIYFAAPYLGRVNAYAITDTQGVARATFCGEGIASHDATDSAFVVASYSRWGLADTVRVYVAVASSVSNIVLGTNHNTGIAGVDSATLQITAYNDDGSRVSGRYVHVRTDCNSFDPDSFLLTNGSPVPAPWWHFCSIITMGTPYKIWATLDDITSDTLRMTVDPGPARFVFFNQFTHMVDVGVNLPITVTVTDSLLNHVRSGATVDWFTTLGTITPSQSATDEFGVSMSNLNGGTTAGNAIVKGSIGGGLSVCSTLVQIMPSGASSIGLDVSNSSPQVRGTGGVSWSELQASVRDRNGNPAPDGIWVTFRIVDQPPILPPNDPIEDAANINRHGILDSAQTSGGVARATFNAGVAPGPVIIEACVWVDSSGRPTCAQVSNISIVSGPPASIMIQPNNVGVDAGASWDITIQALVSDVYNNPVRNGVAVFFSVTDTASILSDTVVTGNGTHHPGVAETILRYISAATNEFVDITARTAGVDSMYPAVMATITYRLPIQQPTVRLYVQPASWQYTIQSPGNGPCHIMCMAVLQDGHSVLINGQNLIYSTTRGRLYATDVTTPGPNPITHRLSGFDPVYGGADPNGVGHGTVWLVEQANWIFPDPLSTEITGDVTVDVEGHPEATDSRVINFRRGNGGGGGRPQ